MKAAVTLTPRGAIELHDLPEPDRPAGEVLVEVRAATVDPLDLAIYQGTAQGLAPTFPLVQGLDAAGVISVGSGSLLPGMQVAVKPGVACLRCSWCRRLRQADCPRLQLFGVHRQGGYAEYLSVPRQNVALLPSELSFVEGAVAANTHAVALRMLRAAGAPLEDADILVTGAESPLGIALCQLGSALGGRVIAIASTEIPSKVADHMGASVLVNATDYPEFSVAAFDVTEGVGVDIALEATGHPGTIAESRRSLARGGTLVVEANRVKGAIGFDVRELVESHQTVVGTAGSNLEDFTDVYRILAESKTRAVVAERFGLDDVGSALATIRDREPLGRVVIDLEKVE